MSDEDWHTYTLEWTSDGIRRFIDGEELPQPHGYRATFRWPVRANWPIGTDGDLNFECNKPDSTKA